MGVFKKIEICFNIQTLSFSVYRIKIIENEICVLTIKTKIF